MKTMFTVTALLPRTVAFTCARFLRHFSGCAHLIAVNSVEQQHNSICVKSYFKALCSVNESKLLHWQNLARRQMSHSTYSGPFGKDLLFRQFLEYNTYTYTYLLADTETNEAVLIDPVLETVDRDVRIIHDLGLKLIYAANTHVHADHVTGTGSLKKVIPSCKSVIAEISKAKGDVKIKEGDFIKFGKFKLEVRSTPGHTDGCMTYVLHEKGLVFTGDALLIRGCGRTDFQQGNPEALYESIHSKILSLPQNFMIFPGHDYTGQTMSTVGEELRYNPRLSKPKNEFIQIMKNLNLPYPKQMDKAVPANMVCGVFDVPSS